MIIGKRQGSRIVEIDDFMAWAVIKVALLCVADRIEYRTTAISRMSIHSGSPHQKEERSSYYCQKIRWGVDTSFSLLQLFVDFWTSQRR